MINQKNNNLDKDKANEILGNVLTSISVPNPSYSVDSVIEKNRTSRFLLELTKYLAVVFLLFAVVSPLFFRKDPDFSIITSSKTVAVTTHNLYDTYFVMVLSGAADYPNIYAKKNDGKIIFPDECDSSTGLVTFPYSGDALNIYIPTVSGECIQALLSSK